MSVRTAAPQPLKQAARRAYVLVGAATASWRFQPGFIVIGAQRCGTTSLFRALMAHPQVVRPAFHKGINYFDLNYQRGPRWYRGHFPVTGPARRRAARYGAPVAFEASGYYLYHPFALERLAANLPDVKLVALLRDPVDRAFSAYKHEYVRGFETESFERALDLEDERLNGEIEKMRADLSYESLSHRHHSYRHRGHYAEQLERAFTFFPQQQVHIIGSEAFFSDPAEQYKSLLAFLGLRPFQPATFGRYNGHRSEPMPPRIRRWLEDYYAPHNQRLAKLLDRPVPWRR
jgi:Sulfotransferase family